MGVSSGVDCRPPTALGALAEKGTLSYGRLTIGRLPHLCNWRVMLSRLPGCDGKPIVGAVRSIPETPAAFAPDRRTPGKAIIRVSTAPDALAEPLG
jgi:hypothetical protein